MITCRDGHEYRVVEFAKTYDRLSFACGIDILDIYLKNQANQDLKRKIAMPYFLVPDNSKKIIGYYTLSAFSIDIGKLPDKLVKKLPKYEVVPATLLGRLAIDQHYQGTKLGAKLLLDALHKSYQTSMNVASMAVIVDAINDAAIMFYKRYGFKPFVDRPNRLFLEMGTISTLFE